MSAEAFESLCLELWREIWQDPNAQKNGRNGQPQAGVTVTELGIETKKAGSFNPPLSAFTLATTGPADEKVQPRARELTEQHRCQGTFSITVWSWRELWQELHRRPELLEKLDPIFWPRLWAAWANKGPAEPSVGDRSVVLRGAAHNSTVVTGDGNVVVHGGQINGDVVARKEIHIYEPTTSVLRSLHQLPAARPPISRSPFVPQSSPAPARPPFANHHASVTGGTSRLGDCRQRP